MRDAIAFLALNAPLIFIAWRSGNGRHESQPGNPQKTIKKRSEIERHWTKAGRDISEYTPDPLTGCANFQPVGPMPRP